MIKQENKQENKQEKYKQEEENKNKTSFTINSSIGDANIDLLEFERAKKHAKKLVNPPELSVINKKIQHFLGGKEQSNYRWYGAKLGALMKYHLDQQFSDCDLVNEFVLHRGIEMPATYSNIPISESKVERYLQMGFRFYENSSLKFVVMCDESEYDTDERITIMTKEEGKALELLEQLEEGFYQNGPLKNAFFDMEYNFISRNEMIDKLLAWNDDIKQQLSKDVIEFLKVMPILREKGLPNSRGIILSGPPGTGKTMMAKSIAAQANVTTMLISAEMISSKSDVKKAFKIGRKLSPTLMIIEDIDTAGTVSRKFTDHPILGEYLQAMDGMEPNDGMLILATTNHTENIDPAISDRPGRFDRIIDVPLPNNRQRRKMIQNLLTKMPSEKISKNIISIVAKKSEGLSGAWVREIVQCAFIEAMYEGKDKLSGNNLQTGLEDVLKRRGMAYRSTPNLAQRLDNKNIEVYTH